MKILFVDTTYEPGDHPDRIARLLNGLVEQNLSICLFCANPRLYRDRLQPGISIHTVDWQEFPFIRKQDSPLFHRSSLGWTRAKRLTRYGEQVLPTFIDILSLEEPDLVHILDVDLSLNPFAEYCQSHEIPFVVHASAVEDVDEKAGNHLPSARRMITCSEVVKKWMMEQFSEIYFRNYEIIPWPVEVAQIAGHHDLDVRDTYKTPPDAKLIVVPGPIGSQYGQQDILNAFAMIRPNLPIAYLWIVGDLYSQKEIDLPQQAASLGISDKVRFLGEPPDMKDVYLTCDLFVYAPRNVHPDNGPVDGVAHCVPWAMAAGLPVIITEAGGAPDYVLGTKAGAVVPPNSPEALESMLQTYLSNDALLSEAAKAAFKRAGNGFSSSAVAARLQAIYHQILEN